MRHRWIVGMALVCLAWNMLPGCRRKPPPPAAAEMPTVSVAHPIQQLVTDYSDVTGVIDAVETVQLRARVSGFIKHVNFIDGTEVTKNDLLIEIDPRPYEAELKQAEGEFERAKAQLKLADANLARNSQLVAKKVISPQDYDTSVAEQGTSHANVESSRAAVDRAQLNLEWTKVTAPISGKIDRAYLTDGNVVTGGLSQGTILTTIVSVEPMYAYFDVDEQTVLYYQDQVRLQRLKRADPKGQNVKVDMRLKNETGYPHHGYIDFASNRLSPSTGTLQIRGVFKNPDRKLIAGLYARARVPISQPYTGSLIPDSAILTDQGKKIVYVVNGKQEIEARAIKTGPQSDGLRIIASGLEPNDWVCIKGMLKVRPGIKVNTQELTDDDVRKLVPPVTPAASTEKSTPKGPAADQPGIQKPPADAPPANTPPAETPPADKPEDDKATKDKATDSKPVDGKTETSTTSPAAAQPSSNSLLKNT